MQDRRRHCEGAMAPTPLSLDAGNLSHSYADEPLFRVWINLAALVKAGHMYFVILCLLTVLGAPCIFPFVLHSRPVAVRTSCLFLHSSSQSLNQQGFSPELRGPLGFLEWASAQETPAPSLLKPTDCISRSLSHQLLPSVTLCPHTVSPQTSRNLPPAHPRHSSAALC